MERLASLEFIRKGQNLFITGSSGTGKSFLAPAMGYEACQKGIRTYYAKMCIRDSYRMVTHVVGHFEHYAGDQMYIDFAGDKLEVVDSESGECRSVEVFVAILPAAPVAVK